eukprot:CAMPEP_0179068040 /NCGR_PEP_ID=MMETSP0796-20121207/29802_1 /TAXON_ID=73915 /ORGANISM="Pyrodinium bahamense, Strain pbaha01" /LENGTH=549 /DNA_ID=CAMNT_0020765093 /DNA_START=228 /DNA_END=1877 /DNA_ORIENTATION=+
MAAILLFGGGVRVATTRSPGRIRSLSVNLGASHRTLELVEAGTPGQWGRLKDKAGKCLDFGGERVHLWECQEENKNQLWRYDDATHHIIAHQRSPDTITSKCLDAGTEIRIADCMDGSDVQAWTLNDNGSISVHKAGGGRDVLGHQRLLAARLALRRGKPVPEVELGASRAGNAPTASAAFNDPEAAADVSAAAADPDLHAQAGVVNLAAPEAGADSGPSTDPDIHAQAGVVALAAPEVAAGTSTGANLNASAHFRGIALDGLEGGAAVNLDAGPQVNGVDGGAFTFQSRDFLVFGLVIGLCLVSLACMVVGFWSWRSSREDHLEGYNTVNTEDMALLKQQVEATETTVNAARLDQDLLQQQLAEEMDELTIQMKETQESLARGWSAGDAIADEDLDMEWERIREEMCTEECRQNSVRLPSGEHGHAEALNNKLPRSQSSWFDSALVSLTQMSADIRLAAKPTVTLPALACSKAEIEAQIQELQRRMAQAEADAREAAKSSRTDPRAKAHALQCLRQRGHYKLLQERLQSVHCQILQAETLQARVGKQP